MTNLDRAKVAEKMLLIQEQSSWNETIKTLNDPESTVADALANLMHFCFLNKVDFVYALELGRRHYDAEKKGW